MNKDDFEDGEFEWNRTKSAEGGQSHGVLFEEARKVFDDPYGLDLEDRRRSYDEQRFIRIATAVGRILFVVWTPRGERRRILSARVAERQERRRYHEQNERW
jgi:uncharacterized DUF497 family protein